MLAVTGCPIIAFTIKTILKRGLNMGTRPCIVKSSGLLVNLNEETLQILINVANLNKEGSRRVKVEVFDWTFNIPIEVPITSFNGPEITPGDGGPITIHAQTGAVLRYRLFR